MSYNPSQLGQLIQQGRFAVVEDSVIAFIKMNLEKNNFIKLAEPKLMERQDKVAYEQQCINSVGAYANVIVLLFCNPKYSPSDSILNIFIQNKQTLELIFSLSSWRTTDPIIEKLALFEVSTIKKHQLSKRKLRTLKTLLALYCLGSKHKLPWPHLFELDVNLAFSAYIGLVTQTVSTFTPERDSNYNELLASAADHPIITLDETTSCLLLAPYFSCSYATGDKKYAFKQWAANILFESTKNWVSEATLAYGKACETKNLRSKPRIGIVFENYVKTHAMYRSYNSTIQNLATKFELIAFINKEQIKKTDLSAFSATISIDENDGLNTHVEQIINTEIDILFYPSIGMSPWVVLLAFMRLAPIQFMAGGHPSSSYSKHIDYFVIHGNDIKTESIQPFINEKVIISDETANMKGYATRHSALSNSFIEEASKYLPVKDETVIGINGVVRKVSSSVIQMCKQIEQRSSKKLKFVFFSMHPEFHLAFMSTKIQIQSQLASFDLVAYSDYESYLKTLSKCHLLLPTFPFGGTNSNIDAMILKKPKLFFNENRQLYTRADSLDWSNVGLQNVMGSDSIEGVIIKALDIIENEHVRSEYFQLMQEHCRLDEIFIDGNTKPKQSINSHVDMMIANFNATLVTKQIDNVA